MVYRLTKNHELKQLDIIVKLNCFYVAEILDMMVGLRTQETMKNARENSGKVILMRNKKMNMNKKPIVGQMRKRKMQFLLILTGPDTNKLTKRNFEFFTRSMTESK